MKWIRISEKLPSFDGPYMVHIQIDCAHCQESVGDILIAVAHFRNNSFELKEDGCGFNITHWMDMPEDNDI